MKIEINKPCHENWEAMSPTEKGAFCKVCTKDVVDFSKKTIEEIKEFFSVPQEGRVCGRFKESQLTELSFDSFFERFTGFQLKRKLSMVIAVSFFAWFFNVSAVHAQDDKHKKGKVKVTTPTTCNNNKSVKPVKDTVKAVEPREIHTKGEVLVAPIPKNK